MPCYVNPNVAKHEREMCEQKWRFFRVVSAAQRQGVEWPNDLLDLIETERRDYLQHRREDRQFLIGYLERHIADSWRPDLKAVKARVLAMSDDELIETYWGTWEDEQLAFGEYRGRALSLAAHPDPHRVEP